MMAMGIVGDVKMSSCSLPNSARIYVVGTAAVALTNKCNADAIVVTHTVSTVAFRDPMRIGKSKTFFCFKETSRKNKRHNKIGNTHNLFRKTRILL